MKYKIARQQIQSGDVLVWSGSSVFSKIIKWWTKSEYTHVGFSWKANGRLFVIESMDGKGVRIFPLSRKIPFSWIKTNVFWTDEIAELTFKHLGDKYSWMGCVRAGLGIQTKKDKRWQCAEFAAYILRKAGLKIGFNIETPAKLVDELIEKKLTMYYVEK